MSWDLCGVHTRPTDQDLQCFTASDRDFLSISWQNVSDFRCLHKSKQWFQQGGVWEISLLF